MATRKEQIREAALKCAGTSGVCGHSGIPDNYEIYNGFINGAEYADSHQWVSVEESLPENYQYVFCLCKSKSDKETCISYSAAQYIDGKYIHQGWYDFSGKDGFSFNLRCEMALGNVTHWMLIPNFNLKSE